MHNKHLPRYHSKLQGLTHSNRLSLERSRSSSGQPIYNWILPPLPPPHLTQTSCPLHKRFNLSLNIVHHLHPSHLYLSNYIPRFLVLQGQRFIQEQETKKVRTLFNSAGCDNTALLHPSLLLKLHLPLYGSVRVSPIPAAYWPWCPSPPLGDLLAFPQEAAGKWTTTHAALQSATSIDRTAPPESVHSIPEPHLAFPSSPTVFLLLLLACCEVACSDVGSPTYGTLANPCPSAS